MASFFNLTLDTTPPVIEEISLNDGALYTTSPILTLTTELAWNEFYTGSYQMKIWGTSTADSEEAASWESYSDEKQITVSSEDGLKTIHVKVRDDVGNVSIEYTDSITLQTETPTVVVSGPDKSRISKVEGYNNAIISFTANVDFAEYKVCVVTTTSATEVSGVTIGTEHGSIATSGSDGNYKSNTPISVTINGEDLETASSGDGVKIIKVFVKTNEGVWSLA